MNNSNNKDPVCKINREITLSDFIAELPDGIILIDEEGYIFEWNPQMETITGTRRQDVIGKYLWEVMPQFTSADKHGKIPLYNLEAEVLHMLKTGQSSRFTGWEKHDLQFADNTHRTIQKMLFPVRTADGHAIAAVIRDITRQKELERSLQESEEKFRALIEASPAMIFISQEDRIHCVNQEFQRVTGYTEEECLHMNFREFVHPDCQNLIKQEKLSHLKKGSTPERYEIKISTKQGDDIWVDLRAAVVSHKAEQAILGALYDITERKKAEQILRKSELIYRTIFETTGTAMMIFDADMLVHLVNTEFEKLSGYSKEEIEHKIKWPQFISKDDVEFMKEYHKKRRSDPRSVPCNYECKLVDKQGNTKNVYINVALIPGTSHSVISFMDITERKQTEEQIKYLSFHDKLTGLYNRAFLEEELKRLDSEEKVPVSLIMGDVNGLKLVNDSFGHKKGDELLQKIAKVLTKSCRNDDIAARWGGDEFVILLPGADKQAGLKVYKRIHTACKNINDFPIPVTIALGLATKDEPAQNMQEVIKEAEDRMYHNKLLESKSNRSSFIKSLQELLWVQGCETKDHCRRLQEMGEKLGRKIELADNEVDDLLLLATLHDIGKITVPTSILSKPDKLSREEWEIVKKHPEAGYRIALSSPELAPVAEAILAHHECWDGSGYPFGLKGEKIPLIARILAIIDAYDVMVTGRPYKKPMNKQAALEEIRRCAGIQFDPFLVRKFIQCCGLDDEQN